MNYHKFARQIIECRSADERREKLAQIGGEDAAAVARELKQICYEVWTSEPQKVGTIARALRELANGDKSANAINACAEWTEAIDFLVNGKLENCLEKLDDSEKSFLAASDAHSAATTQISKLYALALLGRYDEAVACGLRARDVFLAYDDLYSAGKIEHNIGNLFWRRDFYQESEPYLASAHRRFEIIGDQRQLAMVENCQAFVKALQNDFRRAEKIYQRALKRAAENDLTVTEAEIEIGVSNLYLFQGKFDLALEYLEKSRQKYDNLQMPHQSAVCELEIADIYLELNLLPEAAEFYKSAAAKFENLGMRAELARCQLNYARALSALGADEDRIGKLFDRAENLFAAEGNRIAAVSVKLARAQELLRGENLDAAEVLANDARGESAAGENLRQTLLSEWLRGEIARRRGDKKNAARIFQTIRRSADGDFRQIEYLSLIGSGNATGDTKFYQAAIDLTENSRAALAGEDFRTAFLADKILPYNRLVADFLTKKDFVAAFDWHERSRSRSLFDAMNEAAPIADEDETVKNYREELNWLYSRINRTTESGLEARREISELRRRAEEREKDLAERRRRQSARKNGSEANADAFDLAALRKDLTDTVLIEFIALGGKISAFVISVDDFEFFENLCGEIDLNDEIRQFLFQIKTGRFLEKLSAAKQEQANIRLLTHSRRVYDLLLRPLGEKLAEKRRVTIVPTGFLHYLPFAALHDGEKFLVERVEVTGAPSAAILQKCLRRAPRQLKNTLLVGYADERAPQIIEEIETLGALFENSDVLLGEQATLANLRRAMPFADAVHLACHGTFRPDNPAFSALHLAGGNLTARDAQTLDLRDKLAVLSACETGLNQIVAGDEPIGLTRGFLAAGAAALVMSLWTVDDSTTQKLMKVFYQALCDGKGFGEALQKSQRQLLVENPHPYCWSSFLLIGHW